MGFIQYLPKKLYFSLTVFDKFYFVYQFITPARAKTANCASACCKRGRKKYFHTIIIYLLLQLSEEISIADDEQAIIHIRISRTVFTFDFI